MGKTMNAFSAQKKTKASPAALGWFSPMASSWQLMTARKLRELDPFSLPQASAPSNPKTQVYGRKKQIFPVHKTPGKERLVECTVQWI